MQELPPHLAETVCARKRWVLTEARGSIARFCCDSPTGCSRGPASNARFHGLEGFMDGVVPGFVPWVLSDQTVGEQLLDAGARDGPVAAADGLAAFQPPGGIRRQNLVALGPDGEGRQRGQVPVPGGRSCAVSSGHDRRVVPGLQAARVALAGDHPPCCGKFASHGNAATTDTGGTPGRSPRPGVSLFGWRADGGLRRRRTRRRPARWCPR